MTFEGFLYVKLGRLGSKTEGPDYWLQTTDREYLLVLHQRDDLSRPDFELEFYNRSAVRVEGELEGSDVVRVSGIHLSQ